MSDRGPDAPHASWTHLRERYAYPVVAWTAVALVLGTIQQVSRLNTRPGVIWPLGAHLDGWVQFDGPEYLQIAEEGYRARQLVWFPVYPGLIRGLDTVIGDGILSGVLVSMIAGVAAAVLFWRWLSLRIEDRRAQATALAVLLLYPYGWFLYGVVYPTALFLALALGAFVLVERGHPVLAGLVAAVATATRPTGFAVAIGLFVVALEHDGVLTPNPTGTGWLARLRVPTRLHRDRLRVRQAGPLLAWLGLAAWSAYLWVVWDDPLRFVSEQRRYHEEGYSTLVKHQYFEAWHQDFDGRHLATTTFQAVVLVVVLGMVPAIGRRYGWGYAAYVAGLTLLPVVSVSTFMGTGRYLLPAFPVFALAGEWLAQHQRLRHVYLATAALLLGLMTFGFTRSWYLT